MSEEKNFEISAEEMEEIKKSQDFAKYGIFLSSRKETLAAVMKEIEELELCISKHQKNVEYYLSLRDNEELVDMLGGEKARRDFDSKVKLAEKKIEECQEKIDVLSLKKREAEEDIYHVLAEEKETESDNAEA